MDFKELIDSRGIRQNWVAKKIGIHAVLLNYYLNGTRPMPEEVKEKLENLLMRQKV